MEDSSPLISVIVPAFNAERYIASTITSVLQQTWEHLELIVVDDGSTDRTESIINQYADQRLKYIRQVNRGCSAAKNTGLSIAKGSFIQYLDADDLLSNDKLEEQLKALKADPLKVAVCRTKVFDEDVNAAKEEIDSSYLFSTDKAFEFLLNLYGKGGRIGMIQPNAFLISRLLSDKAGDWNTSISPSPDEDGEYYCRAILASTGIVFTEKPVNYYRKQAGSSSLSRQASHHHAYGLLKSLELKEIHLLTARDSDDVRQVIAMHYALFIYNYFALYPDLVEKAESNLKRLKVKKLPLIGGRNFKMLSRLVGFKQALQIRQKVLNRF